MDLALQRAVLLATYGSSQLEYLITHEKQLATYFFAMLADVDRARQYQRAIEACIRDFAHAHPDVNPIHVLDIGVGTGLLTLFASQTRLPGDRKVKVLAIDTNKHAIEYATRFLSLANAESMDDITLVQVDKAAAKARAKLARTKRGTATGDTYGDNSIDIVVSEILGTYAESEFVHPILQSYKSTVRLRGGRFFVVPEVVTQSLVTRRLSDVPVGAAHLLRSFATRASRHFQLTSSQHLSALFVGCGLRDIKTDPLVRLGRDASGEGAAGAGSPAFFPRKRESFTRAADPAQLHAMALVEDPRQGDEFGLGPGESVLSFIEWTAILWRPRVGPDIVLRNSLDGYRDAADPYTALARNEAWGLAVLGPTGDAQPLGTLAESQTPNVGHYTLGHYDKPSTRGGEGADGHSIPDQEIRMMMDYDFADRLVAATRARLARSEGRLTRVLVYEDCTGGLFPATLAREVFTAQGGVPVTCVFKSPGVGFHATSEAMREFNRGRADLQVRVYVQTRSNRAPRISLDALDEPERTLCVIPKWILFDAKESRLASPRGDLATLPRQQVRIAPAKAHLVTLLDDAWRHGLDRCGTAMILKSGFRKKCKLEDNAFLGVLKQVAEGDPRPKNAFTLLIDTPYVDDEAEQGELPLCDVANLSRMTDELQSAWTSNKPRAMRVLASIQARCTAHRGLSFSTRAAGAAGPTTALPSIYRFVR